MARPYFRPAGRPSSHQTLDPTFAPSLSLPFMDLEQMIFALATVVMGPILISIGVIKMSALY